jgi:hypothetical protein
MSESEKNEKYAQSLLEQLRGQAKRGGLNVAKISREKAQPGPYWPKEAWEKYCGRIKSALVTDCGYSGEQADKLIAENSTGVILVESQ